MFENPHGKAPELVGANKANPIPMLRPAVLMLEHIGEKGAAARIDQAMRAAVEAGLRTADMGGDATTEQARDAIIANL